MDYKNGKIYQIVNDVDDAVYVGSTCQALSKRMAQHRASMNKEKCKGTKFYQHLRDLGHEHFRIELLCEHPCENVDQLRAKEGEYIRHLKPQLNKRVEKRDRKTWYEDNKEEILEKCKEYKNKNKDIIKQKSKIYHEQNKEQINKRKNEKYDPEKKKDYYEQHKAYIRHRHNQWAMQLFLCECGAEVRKDGKSKHLNSKKHQTFISQQNI